MQARGRKRGHQARRSEKRRVRENGNVACVREHIVEQGEYRRIHHRGRKQQEREGANRTDEAAGQTRPARAFHRIRHARPPIFHTDGPILVDRRSGLARRRKALANERSRKRGAHASGRKTPNAEKHVRADMPNGLLALSSQHSGTTAEGHRAACGKARHKIRIAYREEPAGIVAHHE